MAVQFRPVVWRQRSDNATSWSILPLLSTRKCAQVFGSSWNSLSGSSEANVLNASCAVAVSV
jgi:hypothetical protein